MKKKRLLSAVFAGIAWSTAGLFVTGLIACGFDTVTIASGRCIFGVYFEEQGIHSNQPGAEFYITIYGSLAQSESENKKQKIFFVDA